jgi:hypothetical protein
MEELTQGVQPGSLHVAGPSSSSTALAATPPPPSSLLGSPPPGRLHVLLVLQVGVHPGPPSVTHGQGVSPCGPSRLLALQVARTVHQ